MGIRFVCDHDSLTDKRGRFAIEPLNKGAAKVLGNALRRILLSQLEGAAVTAVKIDDVLHEFALIPGAIEDTSEVIRNLKNLKLKMSGSGTKKLHISATGVVTGRDIKADDGVTILNPDTHIVTLSEEAKFVAEIEVDTGVGFRQAEEGSSELGTIVTDADFSPALRVGYAVKELDNGQESLSLELHTDGSISPLEAIKKAVIILRSGLVEKQLVSGDFDETHGKFIINTGANGYAIGSILKWTLMSHLSADKKEHVTFADYSLQDNGNMVLEIQTDGKISPKAALSVVAKELLKIIDTLIADPIKERGRPSMPICPTGSKNGNGTVAFGEASSIWQAPDFLDIKLNSYRRFLQRGILPADRKCVGLQKILTEIFPIKHNGLTLDCLGYSCGKPSHNPLECLDISLTYSLPVMLQMSLTLENGRTVEEEVSLGDIPLMTDDGIFIIKGLKRTIVGELVGSGRDIFNDLAQKSVKTAGDFFYEHTSEALTRLREIANERIAVADSTDLTPSAILCADDSTDIQTVVAALSKFFSNSRFSQIIQDTNSLDSLTHSRRLLQHITGDSVVEVPEKPRVLHHSLYGRVCPLETPEGPNVGLIGSLATYARVDEKGNILSPYRKVKNGKPSDQVVYLSAKEERELKIAPASSSLASKTVPVRADNRVYHADPKEVDYMDAYKSQTPSISGSLVPLLEHDDPNRALMGCNMQRQAVPLLFPEQPIIQTGAEAKIALDSREVISARRDGTVKRISEGKIEVWADDGSIDTYNLLRHRRNMSATRYNQRPVVFIGQKITEGQILADGPSSTGGALALGRNILMAYMAWEGYNYEDAILVSEKLIKDDVLTSVHMATYQTEIRDTRYGRDILSKQPPGAVELELSHLGSDGIVKVGAWVTNGDVLVGKMSPKSGKLSPEEKLLRAINEQNDQGSINYGDSSLRMPPGGGGLVTKVVRLSRDKGDPLPKGVHEIIKVEITAKRKAKVGDKLSNRHGSKGIISKILPEEDMPFMPDGTPIEMALNPLGVHTRMNIGQVLEAHLGWAAQSLGINVIAPPYDGPTIEQIKELLVKAGLPESGMMQLCDGRTGRPVDTDITVGCQYILKLIHLVDDKVHARSIGPYSFFTQQPTGGKAHFGGQRFGEMEGWALEAYGAAYNIRELLTVKSDDVVGRRKMYESILKESNPAALTPSIPEAVKKLIFCLRGAALDMKGHKKNGEPVSTNVDNIAAMNIALASPEKIRDEWSNGEVHVESTSWERKQPSQGGLFCEEIFGQMEPGVTGARNERMGHINLAVPVCHNWFLAAKPSPIAVFLGLDRDDIKSVVYYKSFVVTDPGDTDLKLMQILDAEECKAQKDKHGKEAFEAGTGAAVIRELLSGIDMAERIKSLDDPQEKLMAKELQKSGIKPEWMILECLPVVPPGMRPSTYLSSGGVATLDLNELYNRVISRNNQYKELAGISGIEAHETARMIQEAVDSLLGNGRRREGETGTLKSLSDLIKGKGGIFRGNLLGKRVDYSGRSVIVVGPDLKLDECGLPESMALELFKPFIVHKLMDSGTAQSIGSAYKMIDAHSAEALQAARDVASERLIMLNRAPTLHRVGVQAFKPILTDKSAIRLHPLVCVGFNADFDGDQMAVHVPLSAEAQDEARKLLLSPRNVLSVAHGGTIAQPSQDIIVGCYYLTQESDASEKAKAEFANILELKKAYELGRIGLHDSIKFCVDGEAIDTTVGRAIFNEIVPSGLGRFINCQMDKGSIFRLIEECHARLGEDETTQFLNDVDDLGFKYATRYGTSIGMDSFKNIPEREKILEDAGELDDQAGAIEQRYSVWSKASEKLIAAAMKALSSDSLNSLNMMVTSGARGRAHQLRNLMCAPGLLSDYAHRIYEMPVLSNYISGMSGLEHFMMTIGARNGLIDVVSRVGHTGYLTRKMVSAAQNVIITEEDCGTTDSVTVSALASGDKVLRKLSARIAGRIAAQEVKHPETGVVVVSAGAIIDDNAALKIEEAGIEAVELRSPITCETNHGLCQKCYGVDLATGAMAKLGDPVGMIAATAAGEPATQLAFRVFPNLMKPDNDYIKTGLPKLKELMDITEAVKITADDSLMSLVDILAKYDSGTIGTLMVDELMRLYNAYGLNVNDKHFEILLSCMLSKARVTDAGDTDLYEGQLVSMSQLRLKNEEIAEGGKLASTEPVLMGIRETALSTDSFLAASAFGDTLNVLAQAAIRGSSDELRGIQENLIIGKLIPAGTGFRK